MASSGALVTERGIPLTGGAAIRYSVPRMVASSDLSAKTATLDLPITIIHGDCNGAASFDSSGPVHVATIRVARMTSGQS